MNERRREMQAVLKTTTTLAGGATPDRMTTAPGDDMKTHRSLIALTSINLALLLFTLAQQLRPAFAQGERLITERGRPSVKIESSEPASGLSFAGPTGTKDTYVILQSKATVSSLKLRNENGREQVLAP